MRNLLRFLIEHHFLLLFLFLETIAFMLLVRFNSFQSAQVFKIRHAVTGRISQVSTSFLNYLSLEEQNKKLKEENARLYNSLSLTRYSLKDESFIDSISSEYFRFIPANIIGNSVNKQYNFITLDKGSLHGIKPDMGVVGPDGLIGVVKTVSKHFCTVVPVLNRELFPNARIKNSNYFGYIEWPGTNYQKVKLKDIPLHALINIGDTIETSGITARFPPGILIGQVIDVEIEKGVNFNISVKLSTDFKKLSHVWIIDNVLKEERLKLEYPVTYD
ncbi:MAG: rod shape-determining protein MreC [Bacteroidales bacterium]|nr:rod shape-determining protein MreC [Bacteroidales bacterium]